MSPWICVFISAIRLGAMRYGPEVHGSRKALETILIRKADSGLLENLLRRSETFSEKIFGTRLNLLFRKPPNCLP